MFFAKFIDVQFAAASFDFYDTDLVNMLLE